MRPSLLRTSVLAGLLGVTFATYAPALDGAFVWDDIPLIEQNLSIKENAYLGQAIGGDLWDRTVIAKRAVPYYRPLVTLSYIFDYRLHGLDARGFHLTNLLFHLLAVVAAFLLLERLLASAGAAALATLLFALHPSRAEAVAWISGRCDVMMGLFAILSVAGFWRALEANGRRRLLFLGLAWLSFAAALLSKESAAVVAIWVPALDLLLITRERRRLLRNALCCHLPLLVVSIAYLAFRASQLGPQDLRPIRRLTVVLQTAGHYLTMVVNPFAPSSLRGSVREMIASDALLLALGAGALLLVAVLVFSPALRAQPVARLGLVWLAAGLGPVLNLRPLGIPFLVAERFLYLPLFGLALVAGVGCLSRGTWLRRGVWVAAAMLAASYAVTAHRRSEDYQDSERFWRRELSLHPKSTVALGHLGRTQVRKRDYQAAERSYLRCVALYLERGEHRAALGVWQHVIEVRLLRSGDGDPFLPQAAAFLKELIAIKGRTALVRGCVDGHCIEVDPRISTLQAWVVGNSPRLHGTLGALLSRLGDDTAVVHLTLAIQEEPEWLEAILNRALARLRARDLAGAEQDLAAVRARIPDSRETRSLADTIRAAAPLLHALARFGPEPERATDPEVHRLLAQLHIVAKVPRRAERSLREVVRLAPTDTEAHALLAYVVGILGRPVEARAVIDAARRELGDSPRLRWVEAELRRLASPR